MTDSVLRQPRHTGNLIAAIATIACCDISMGLTLQLVPLLMERAHLPAWVIGLNTAAGYVGTLAAGPFLPGLVSRFGSRRVVVTAIASIVTLLVCFRLSPSIWLWFLIRPVFGLSANALFTISEAWVLTFAGDEGRGRVMGVYTSVLALSFAVGPLVIPLTGIDGWAPWAIGIVCCLVSALPLTFVTVADNHFEEDEPWGYFRFFAKAPMLLAAVAAATLFDSVYISFFTIFGLRHGLPLGDASWLLGFGILGNVVLFYPMGWLADHWSRSGMVAVTALATVALSLALIPSIGTWMAWPVTVVLTASAFGTYVVALAVMGDNFKGADLIAGSAAMGAMWGIGGLTGPPLAGILIDTFGINAMPFTLASFYVLLLVALAMARGRLVRTKPDAR